MKRVNCAFAEHFAQMMVAKLINDQINTLTYALEFFRINQSRNTVINRLYSDRVHIL